MSDSSLTSAFDDASGTCIIDSYDPQIVDIDNHGHFYLGTFHSLYVNKDDAFLTTVDMADATLNYAFWPPSKNTVATQVEITGIPIANTTAHLGGIVPAKFCNCKIADSKSIIPSVTENQAAHSMVPSAEHQKAVSFAVAACHSRNMKSVVTTLTDKSGVVVAEVLHNSQGMYIRRVGLPTYARCVQKIANLKQRHQFTNVEFPQIRPSTASDFPKRSVGPTINAIIGSKCMTGITPVEVLMAEGPDVIEEPSKIGIRYGTDPLACAQAAKAAAISSGGNAITGLISGVFGIGNEMIKMKAKKFTAEAAAKATIQAASLKKTGTIKSAQIATSPSMYNANVSSQMLDKQLQFQRSLLNQNLMTGNRPVGADW